MRMPRDPLISDVVEVRDFVLGGPTQIPLAGPANRQGRIAADHIFGRPSRYRGTQGTAILRLFDMTLAMSGAGEKSLQRAGRAYRKVYVHPSHHAGYYPDAQAMTLKLLFAPDTGRVLGAQATGGSGVDKRIDVLAVAIQAGLTVYDLEELELAYSPQFGSAKDPVNMAGFVAAGVLREDHPQTTADQLGQLPKNAVLVDVREPDEFAAGHIPGAINIPVDDLRERCGELPTNRPIVAYCQVGIRGYLATRILLQAGRSGRQFERRVSLVLPDAGLKGFVVGPASGGTGERGTSVPRFAARQSINPLTRGCSPETRAGNKKSPRKQRVPGGLRTPLFSGSDWSVWRRTTRSGRRERVSTAAKPAGGEP